MVQLFSAERLDAVVHLAAQAGAHIYIGNHAPTPLMDYIAALCEDLDRPAIMQYLPMQPSEVPATAADTSELKAWVGFEPYTPGGTRVQHFVDWNQEYFAS